MAYLIIFLPSIISLIVLLISFKYGRNKNSLIIAAVTAMVIFMLTKEIALYRTINYVVVGFVFAYLFTSLIASIKK